jgi:hypothetical protein
MAAMSAESPRGAHAAADETAPGVTDVRKRVRFGIRAELLIAFAGMAAMTIIATLVALYAFARVDLAVTRITESSVPYMSRAHAIAAQVADITASAPELMASATQEGRARARDALTQTERHLSELTRQLAAVQADPEALVVLESLQDEMASNLADLDRIVETRLNLGSQREAIVARLVYTHRQVLENLEPAVNGAMLDAMRLQDIKTEANMSAGLIAQAALTDDRDLLGPLKEKFTASAAALTRNIRSVSDPAARVALLEPIQTLTTMGTGNMGADHRRRFVRGCHRQRADGTRQRKRAHQSGRWRGRVVAGASHCQGGGQSGGRSAGRGKRRHRYRPAAAAQGAIYRFAGPSAKIC